VVTIHPVITDRMYSGFAGANGLTSMNLGKRGRMITIEGKLTSDNHNNYQSARMNLLSKIYKLEKLSDLAEGDYTYMGQTHKNIIFDKLELLPSYGNQYYIQDSKGYLSVRFIYYCRSLSDE
jgi:hypothetical protein